MDQLSEDYIRKNKDKINWCLISAYQKLSEKIIRDYQDKVDWFWISANQKLSKEFIKEFKYKIYFKILLQRFGYTVYYNFENYQIKFGNYCSEYLEFDEFVDLVIKLISLKAFK